ncbi:alpha/beta fold hydrolase [Gordonia hydrophobica]|uniref:Alpha/beta fold hydrolase n=1 Tax=Gordonia hydrophobica TaxID=40516 RepID=A0ABZ2U0H9_9ACTN|nr:alpha/beta fold hydrolase [Gordonia hydrophobica]MBM7367763.1 pimeloyl-ACP methyl ester carboxylesterase [Gordonia hydrophobica]
MQFTGHRRARGRGVAALIATLTATILTGALLAGCATGPDTGPDIVRGDQGNDAGPAKPTGPALSAPKNSLNWKSCSDRIAKQYAEKIADGVTLDCASYDVPANADNPTSNTIRIGVVRARTDATPKDAVPIVLTSGDDMPSSRALLLYADRDGRSLLDKQPIVAVDHRGFGTSGQIDCMTTRQRSAYTDNGATANRDTEARADGLAESARSAADQCNDTLSPDQLDYSALNAASDLEQLRTRWDVDRLALLSIGSGSSVALAYAAEHPDNVGRLILDSPVGYNVSAKDAAASRAKGLQATLAAFVNRCAGAGCAFGATGLDVVGRLVNAGATPRDGALSDTEVLMAVTTALALDDTSADGLKAIGTALVDADRGDTAALKRLADRGRAVRLDDGQLLARCNDMRGRPGGDEIPSLARDWSKENPLTGTTTALDLARCDGWGVTDTPAAPDQFAVAPLILVGANDPINGSDAANNLTPLFLAANTDPTTVAWDGLGYAVSANSRCAADLIGEYLGPDPLGAPSGRTCPV